jgi:hypothetical protein
MKDVGMALYRQNRNSETGIDLNGDPCYDNQDTRGASGLV